MSARKILQLCGLAAAAAGAIYAVMSASPYETRVWLAGAVALIACGVVAWAARCG